MTLDELLATITAAGWTLVHVEHPSHGPWRVTLMDFDHTEIRLGSVEWDHTFLDAVLDAWSAVPSTIHYSGRHAVHSDLLALIPKAPTIPLARRTLR